MRHAKFYHIVAVSKIDSESKNFTFQIFQYRFCNEVSFSGVTYLLNLLPTQFLFKENSTLKQVVRIDWNFVLQ